MLFSEEFVGSIRHDPVRAALEVCSQVIAETTSHEGWADGDYGDLMEAYSLLVEVIELDLLPVKLNDYPMLVGEADQDCSRIYGFLQMVQKNLTSNLAKVRASELRSHFRAALGGGFFTSFLKVI